SIQTDGQTDVFEVIRPCVKHPSNGLLYHRATANMVSIATNVSYSLEQDQHWMHANLVSVDG
ncbi:hypothetical protein J6590_055440, partial [Homalodisca vitripennis]